MRTRSSSVTRHLLEKLLRDQDRRAKRERKMPFAKKLRVLDQLMMRGEARVEDSSRQ